MQYDRFGVAFLQWKGDNILWGETFIVLEAYIIAFLICIWKVRSLLAAYSSPFHIKLRGFCKGCSKIEHKMSDLGYPLSTGKDVLSSKERHPLLLTWFITLLWCMMYSLDGRSFWKHLSAIHGSYNAISSKVDFQFEHKMSDLGVASQCRKWDTVLQGRKPIAAEMFRIFLLLHKVDGMSFSKHLSATYLGHTVQSQPRLTLKLHTKHQIWGTLSSHGMRSCVAGKDIHWCWGVS